MRDRKAKAVQEAKDKKEGKPKQRSQQDKDEMAAFLAAGPEE